MSIALLRGLARRRLRSAILGPAAFEPAFLQRISLPRCAPARWGGAFPGDYGALVAIPCPLASPRPVPGVLSFRGRLVLLRTYSFEETAPCSRTLCPGS